METGTLIGVGVATGSALLVAAGVALARSRQSRCGFRTLVAWLVGGALVAAACGAMVAGVAAHGYLSLTVPDCAALSESTSPGAYCLDGSDRAKQAVGVAILGGLVAGMIGGCLAAWWSSRSLRMVTGGALAALGTSVLVIESMVVLVLWAA